MLSSQSSKRHHNTFKEISMENPDCSNQESNNFQPMEGNIELILRAHNVKKVVDYRLDNGKRFYKVKWESSWEDEDTLTNYQSLVNQFWSFIDRVKFEDHHPSRKKPRLGGEFEKENTTNFQFVDYPSDGNQRKSSSDEGPHCDSSKLTTLAEVTHNQRTALNSPLGQHITKDKDGNVVVHVQPGEIPKQIILNRPAVSLSTKTALKKVKKEENKIFFCRDCQRGFSRRDMCARHERLHTKEFCYFCNICAQGFMRRYVLVRHLSRVHQTDDINQILTTKKQRRDGIKKEKSLVTSPTQSEKSNMGEDLKAKIEFQANTTEESMLKEQKIQVIEAYKLNEEGVVDPGSLQKIYFSGSSVVVRNEKGEHSGGDGANEIVVVRGDHMEGSPDDIINSDDLTLQHDVIQITSQDESNEQNTDHVLNIHPDQQNATEQLIAMQTQHHNAASQIITIQREENTDQIIHFEPEDQENVDQVIHMETDEQRNEDQTIRIHQTQHNLDELRALQREHQNEDQMITIQNDADHIIIQQDPNNPDRMIAIQRHNHEENADHQENSDEQFIDSTDQQHYEEVGSQQILVAVSENQHTEGSRIVQSNGEALHQSDEQHNNDHVKQESNQEEEPNMGAYVNQETNDYQTAYVSSTSSVENSEQANDMK